MLQIKNKHKAKLNAELVKINKKGIAASNQLKVVTKGINNIFKKYKSDSDVYKTAVLIKNKLDLLDDNNIKQSFMDGFDNINNPDDCLIAFMKNYKINLKKMIREGKNAKEKLIEDNKTLVYHVVNGLRYVNDDMYNDLIGVGMAVFVRCIDTYDPSKSELSTYAYTCIRRECLKKRASEYLSLVKIPTNRLEIAYKVINDKYQKEDSNNNESGVENAIRTALDIKSLDNTIIGYDGISLAETIADPECEIKRNNIIDAIFYKELVSSALDKISDIEKRVIQLRAGIDEGEYTLEETSNIIYEEGVAKKVYTKERIRQIENEAKNKLKRILLASNSKKSIIGA